MHFSERGLSVETVVFLCLQWLARLSFATVPFWELTSNSISVKGLRAVRNYVYFEASQIENGVAFMSTNEQHSLLFNHMITSLNPIISLIVTNFAMSYKV